MKVVSFLNNKGGVGKTTLCLNLARFLSQFETNKILLVDGDEQRSLSCWHNAGDGLGMDLVSGDTRASLLSTLKIGRQIGASMAMIDTPGKLMSLSGAALSMSDLVVIPVQASPLDVWATQDTVDLVRAARNANPKLHAIIVINQAIPNCTINKEVMEIIIQEMPDIHLARTIIHGRIALARNVNEGKTALESKDKLAINEIDGLATELIGALYAIKTFVA